MKTKLKTKRYFDYKLSLFFLVVLFLAFSFNGKSNQPIKKENKLELKKREKSHDVEVEKEFSGIKSIDISTISGNCKVFRSDDSIVKVTLTHHYKPARTYEPIFEQKGDVLKLKEHMTGSNSGNSEWVLVVPAQTNINFKSASGSMSIKDITGKIKVRTASGHVIVSLAESPKFDISISSASGNTEIDFNNNPIAGTIEMKARADIGKIECPIEFTSQEEESDGNQAYMVRSVVVENESPVFKIHTASGTAILKK